MICYYTKFAVYGYSISQFGLIKKTGKSRGRECKCRVSLRIGGCERVGQLSGAGAANQLSEGSYTSDRVARGCYLLGGTLQLPSKQRVIIGTEAHHI